MSAAKESTLTRAALERDLGRAIDGVLSHRMGVALELSERLERAKGDSGDAVMHRAGLWRSAQSYADGAFADEAPDWRLVKALHRVRVLAEKYMNACRGEVPRG